LLSEVFHLHNESTPVHSRFEISITPKDVPPELYEKLCIVNLNDPEKINYSGGIFKDGKIQAQLRKFGKYALSLDTIPPTIKPLNFFSGKDFSKEAGMRFKIEDNLSGIISYNGYIDNQWVLFVYDPKNDLLFYEFDDKVPILKKNHELEIYLTDDKGNKKEYHSFFYR
jgi:hypothetical protein